MKIYPKKNRSDAKNKDQQSKEQAHLLGIQRTFGMTRIYTMRKSKNAELDIDLLLQQEINVQQGGKTAT